MISIIMPAYNAEKTIRQAILSVMQNQGTTDVEVIVVDDGSTDQTPNILRELQMELDNLHVARQRNMGPGAARNVALKQARGDYIGFLDADDYYAPQTLGRMVARMRWHSTDTRTDACVAGTRYLLYGIPISSGIECWHQIDQKVVDARGNNNFLVEITPAVRGKMFRREVLEGLEFTKGKWEDLAFIPAALAKAGRIAILDEPVYNYRIHLNTTVKDFFRRCPVGDVLASLGALERNLQHAGVYDKVQSSFRSMLVLHTVFRMQNVMTWLGVSRSEKRQIILGLEGRLSDKHPDWREDVVLGDSDFAYKDPFFRFMLQKLYKNYLC